MTAPPGAVTRVRTGSVARVPPVCCGWLS
jgi:hypothetical protein